MARPRRSRRTITTFLVLVLLSVTIVSLDESGKASSFTSGVKSLASDVFSPLRSGVNGILDPIGRFFAGAANYGSLQKENQKLQDEIGALRQQVAGSKFDSRQYRQLQQMLAAEKLPSLNGLTMVAAESTAVNVSNFTATITIDKGHAAGVATGDPVMGAGGLIGQVVSASHSAATVRLVTDGQSKVGVTYGSNQFATLDGRGEGKALNADFVPPNATIHKGTVMYTDGLQGAQFPPGIPVARVSSVQTVTASSDKVVTATPIANLQALTYVTVVQWSPTP